MKVILISRVTKLGAVGDIVNIKDGYAKNFLIPQKKAIFYSAVNYKIFESRKQQFEVENQKHSSSAESNKAKLNGRNIVILGNASDDDRLYGSITTATVAAKVNEVLGSKIISRIDVLLKKPIKNIGVHDVKIDLYSGIIAEIKIVVGRSQSEAEALIAKILLEEKTKSKTVEVDTKAEAQPEAISA